MLVITTGYHTYHRYRQSCKKVLQRLPFATSSVMSGMCSPRVNSLMVAWWEIMCTSLVPYVPWKRIYITQRKSSIQWYDIYIYMYIYRYMTRWFTIKEFPFWHHWLVLGINPLLASLQSLNQSLVLDIYCRKISWVLLFCQICSKSAKKYLVFSTPMLPDLGV